MQQDLIQNATQPFINLARSNMELINKMMPTPAAPSTSMNEVQTMFQQPVGLPRHFGHVAAFANMAQCMLHNYVVFTMEVGRCTTAAMLQGQDTLKRAAQQATDGTDQNAHRYQQQGNHHDKKVAA